MAGNENSERKKLVINNQDKSKENQTMKREMNQVEDNLIYF